MVLKLVKKLADPKFIKNLADDVVQPVSKQTDEVLEESFFKIKDDVASPEIKQTDQMLYKDEKISNVEYDKRIKELDKAKDVETWQAEAKKLVKNERLINPEIKTPELKISAKNLIENKITRKEHLANVDKYKPVSSWDNLPREPSNKALVYALDADKREKGLFVLAKEIAKDLKVKISSLKIGDIFNGRLDIPAYTKHDTWIISGTSPNVRTKEGGGVTNYAKAVHYGGKEKPVKFIASQKSGEKIGTGEVNKFPYATISGVVKDLDVNRIRQKAIKYLNDPEWTQAGFDPRRQSSLYVRSGENKHVPIREGSEVIQIGPLVLVKNAKLDFAHTGYDTGGNVKRELVGTPTKEKTKAGRTVYRTKEGERVSEKSATVGPIEGKYYNVPSIYAGKRYTDDELREAIKNNRLIPTSVHDSRPEAEAAAKKRSNELNKGGAMLNQQMKMAFMQEGGLKDEGGTVDPVSGNDVPSGSMKEEVRDDVPAMLSEGEFVFPADVVRYIGLSKLMQMRQQAKMGLKIMEEMGQMGNSEEATLPDDFGIPDIEVIEDDEDDAPEMAQGGVIHAQQGTDVQDMMYRRSENRPSVGAVLMPDGTIDNSAMMDLYNRRQPQQTDFERMMGYGAGQGSNPYGPRRVPYKKEDGTIVNVLEDYMGRPMEDIEGLTRVNPYQAGPIFGGDTPAGGGIVSPVMPPMPVDPTDDTAARRDRDAFYGKGADSTGRLTSMAEARKQGKKLGDFSDAYEAHQARLNDPTRTGNLLEDLKIAGKDLAGRPERFKTDFKNLIESLPDDLKNTTKNIVDAITNKKSSNKKSSRKLSASERRAAKKSKELKKTDYKDKKSIDAKKAETTKKAKKAGFSADDKYGALKKGGLMKRNYP